MPQLSSSLGAGFVQLLTPTNTTAETTTVVGVDLQDYIDDLLVVLSVKRPNNSATTTCSVTFKDSADNSTFTALTSPTFATIAASNTQTVTTVSINTRAIRRYLQVAYITEGTTGTFNCSVVGIGTKQLV